MVGPRPSPAERSEAGTESVRETVTVEDTADRAFAVFTGEMTAWWPRDYTWSVEALDRITVEPRIGGRWYERDVDGKETDWGRVTEWDPPRRLVLTWRIGPFRQLESDPRKASEIEVRFMADGTLTTRTVLDHRGFDRHGGDAAAYRASMASEKGWPKILAHFADAVARAD